MVPFLRTWTLNIVTVVIFIAFVEMLLPNSSMKKYIKMVVGLLVILVILNPILELVNGKMNIQDEIFKSSAIVERQVLSQRIDKFQNFQDQQILSVYKLKIMEHLKEKIKYEYGRQVVHGTIEIEENRGSKEFGKIKKISMVISHMDAKYDGKSENGIKPVEKITVQVNGNQEKFTSATSNEDDLVSDIKNNISKFYDVDKDNINISVYKTSR